MIVFTILIVNTYAFYQDTLTVSPNIYDPINSPHCLTIMNEGTLSITQNFDESLSITRKTTLIMTDSENTDAIGHELCIANGFLTKGAGPIGLSIFEMEYTYTQPYIFDTNTNPLLIRLRIDLPQYMTLNFTAKTVTNEILTETYALGDFMAENTDYTLAVFNSIYTPLSINSIKYTMLPSENNVDLRISYPKLQQRTNYLQFRHVESSPYDQRAILSVDGNILTTWRTNIIGETTNLTVYFPIQKMSKSVTLRWLAPPTTVTLGYLKPVLNTNSTTFIQIQKWENKHNGGRPINKSGRLNMPTEQIDNFHVIISGFAVLTEIEYPN